jgi:hypothetical protein
MPMMGFPPAISNVGGLSTAAPQPNIQAPSFIAPKQLGYAPGSGRNNYTGGGGNVGGAGAGTGWKSEVTPFPSYETLPSSRGGIVRLQSGGIVPKGKGTRITSSPQPNIQAPSFLASVKHPEATINSARGGVIRLQSGGTMTNTSPSGASVRYSAGAPLSNFRNVRAPGPPPSQSMTNTASLAAAQIPLKISKQSLGGLVHLDNGGVVTQRLPSVMAGASQSGSSSPQTVNLKFHGRAEEWIDAMTKPKAGVQKHYDNATM